MLPLVAVKGNVFYGQLNNMPPVLMNRSMGCFIERVVRVLLTGNNVFNCKLSNNTWANVQHSKVCAVVACAELRLQSYSLCLLR